MTHDLITLSRYELHTRWCIDDVCEAYAMIDQIDEARRPPEAA